MTYKSIFEKLREMCNQAEFESTRSIYLKNPIKIGENENGALLCTYIDNNVNPFYGVDSFTFNVIKDEKECELYGIDYDFEFILFNDKFKGTPRFINGMKDDSKTPRDSTIKIYPNAMFLVLTELLETGLDWIEYQKNLRIRSRFFHRNAIYSHDVKKGGRFAEYYKELSWLERLERVENDIETNFLMWRRPTENCNNVKTLKEMKDLGEIEYDKITKIRNERMRKMMKGLGY